MRVIQEQSQQVILLGLKLFYGAPPFPAALVYLLIEIAIVAFGFAAILVWIASQMGNDGAAGPKPRQGISSLDPSRFAAVLSKVALIRRSDPR